MKILLIISLFFSISIFSAEPIKKGDPAPFKGVIFTSKEGRELVAKDKKRIKLEQLQIHYEDKIDLQKKRIDMLRDHLEDQDKFGSIGKTGWFIIGFVVGGTVFYYSAKAIKHLD